MVGEEKQRTWDWANWAIADDVSCVRFIIWYTSSAPQALLKWMGLRFHAN